MNKHWNKIRLVSLFVLVSASIADAAPPNIVLVMADDQGWGDTGYNGHPYVQTPELDAMAAEGFVLDRFYAAAPICSPTRASIMSGRTPVRTKVTSHGRYMRPQEQTIAESLKAAGGNGRLPKRAGKGGKSGPRKGSPSKGKFKKR